MASFQNPFLRGMYGAQEAAERSQQNQIAQAGGMLSIQNAIAQQQMQPLKMEQLRMAIAKAKGQQEALQRIGGGAQQGQLAQGAAVGDVGPTVSNAARPTGTPDA